MHSPPSVCKARQTNSNDQSSSTSVTRFRNCRVLVDGHGVGVSVGDIWIRGGKVIDPTKLFYTEKRTADVVWECHRLIAAPGFIDLQVNGALGVDFSSFEDDAAAERGIKVVAKRLLQHGVTGFCPTLVTSLPEYYQRVLPLMAKRCGGQDGAAILGVHCEGPFINARKKGAHTEACIRGTLSPKLLLECYGCLDNVAIVTLAPELPGADQAIKWLTQQGVVVSLGHSMANLDIAEKAVNYGASLITHLFNSMLPFHHRDPGIVGLLTSLELSRKQMYYGLIADGVHTHETVMRIAHMSNKQGAVLVTDVMAAMGLCEGEHNLGHMTVNVVSRQRTRPTKTETSPAMFKDIDASVSAMETEANVQAGTPNDVLVHVATVKGTDTLAGSTVTMDDSVRVFKKATACTIKEALEAASLHPAQVLRLEAKKGTLNCGADADIVLLDENLHVMATVIAGEIVYRSEHCRLSRIS